MNRIPEPGVLPLDPLKLAAERERLVRYCSRQVRNREVAEDLAQETLLIAWERWHTLRDGDVWQSWLTGIARIVCLRHLRRIGVEKSRLVSATGEASSIPFDSLADTSLPDLDELLEKSDLCRLIDSALSDLPAATHTLLVDRYIFDLPIEEIAARRGIRDETATVQLYRSRQALRRVLSAPEHRSESVALGLIDEESVQWQETRLWCPDCGIHRLEGILCCYDGDNSPMPLQCPVCQQPRSCLCDRAANRKVRIGFALRCSGCMQNASNTGQEPTHLLSMGNAWMLEGIRGFKPALNRVNRWWSEWLQETIDVGAICCKCGERDVALTNRPAAGYPWPSFMGKVGLFSHCPRCGGATAIEAHEIARQTAEGMKFWQKVPRFRTLPVRFVPSANGPLIVTRMESITDSNAIEIALHEQTMRLVDVVCSI